MISLTDELLDRFGKEYEEKKTNEIIDGIYEYDTFYIFVERRMKEIAA